MYQWPVLCERILYTKTFGEYSTQKNKSADLCGVLYLVAVFNPVEYYYVKILIFLMSP